MKITYKQRDDDEFDDVATYAKRNYLLWLHFGFYGQMTDTVTKEA